MKRHCGYACVICGRREGEGVAMEIDHFVPVARGGTNDAANLRLLCRLCNRAKSDQMPDRILP